jgi:hypothetical protein
MPAGGMPAGGPRARPGPLPAWPWDRDPGGQPDSEAALRLPGVQRESLAASA